MEAYFDNSATTKVFDCVRDAVVSAMCVDYGNPAARHRKGVEAENIIKEASFNRIGERKLFDKKIGITYLYDVYTNVRYAGNMNNIKLKG